jgi:hypothetical protein
MQQVEQECGEPLLGVHAASPTGRQISRKLQLEQRTVQDGV